MLKLFVVEFTGNFSAELWGERRQNFKKGDRVLVTYKDMATLRRLGNDVLAEKEVEVGGVFGKEDLKGSKEEKAPKFVETLIPELETPIVPLETNGEAPKKSEKKNK